jgi:hypothetical protein
VTDTQRIDWLERTGANVISDTSESLLPASFSVCVPRVTGWQTRPTLRDAIDAAEREQRTHAGALTK